ncbi:50S ribosomal protein L24e [Candidatus Woesearchaeota archaeon]|nr:50S ribosomal protein L24e [Candidatus Woesearchaeota archaeon]
MQCTFCGRNIPRGTGKIYVKTDGRIFYFCSNKCEKNLLKLNRNPRTSGWTAEYHRLKEVEKTAKTKESSEKPAKTKVKQAEKKEE